MSNFNSREYMEAMQKANKHGGMLYPVRLVHVHGHVRRTCSCAGVWAGLGVAGQRTKDR